MARLGTGTTTDTTSTSNELYYAGEAFRLAYDVGAGTGSRRESTNFENYVIRATAIAVEVTDGDLTTAAPYGLCQVDSNVANDTFTTKVGCSGNWIAGKKPDGTTVGGVDAKVNLIPDGRLDISTRDGECRITTAVLDDNDDPVLDENGNATYDSITQQDEDLAQKRKCTPDVAIGNCVGGTNAGAGVTETACESPSGADEVAGVWFEYDWKPNTAKQEGKFYIYISSDVLGEKTVVSKSTGLTINKGVGFKETPQPGSPLYIAYSIDYTEDDPSGGGDNETRVIETDVIGFRWTPMFTI